MFPGASCLSVRQILPSIANAHPAVRNMAVVCLGMCTLHSKELAKTHMVLLLQVHFLHKWFICFSPERVSFRNMSMQYQRNINEQKSDIFSVNYSFIHYSFFVFGLVKCSTNIKNIKKNKKH